MKLPLIVALVTAVTLTACGSDVKEGVVTSTEFNKAHDESYTYCAAWAPIKVGNVTIQNCTYWATGHDHVPDRWRIRIKDEDGKRGWIKVTRGVYARCPIDATYPTCAG